MLPVEAKTPPLFGSALYVGALLARGSRELAQSLEGLGFQIGKLIQINDDLKDALEVPARPDWQQQWNNLPILYAMTADHEERLRFIELLDQIEQPEALSEAQEILFRCGAVSYCAYHIIELYRDAQRRLGSLSLPDPEPIDGILQQFIGPLESLFQAAGIETPEVRSWCRTTPLIATQVTA